RRDADAFCRRCDYPLFWARGAVTALTSDEGGEGLRRLPGTAGRQDEVAIPCRICREPNRPAAVVCIRCGAEMAAPPPPAPEPIPEPAPAPPPPEPEPEPEAASRLWLWLTIAGVVGLVLLLRLLSLDCPAHPPALVPDGTRGSGAAAATIGRRDLGQRDRHGGVGARPDDHASGAGVPAVG